MKLILKKVKIYGFDPESFKTFTNNGNETKQYSVALYISQEQRNLIDSYIYGKCELTKDNEVVFYGKSKQPIPLFDPEKKKIEKAIYKVFIADVSILIDEFTNNDGETIRYSKCLGIKFISLVENEQARISYRKKYDIYDEIFGDDNSNSIEKNEIKITETEQNDLMSEPPVFDSTFETETDEINDLPF
jgi:hypothetical protein